MDYYENIIEYYDELFPVSADITSFICSLGNQIKQELNFPGLIRILDVECATGVLAQQLVAHNFDVTGFDSSPQLLESAIRRRKQPFTNSRFLEMSMLDMGHYLCKGAFHILLCLENCVAAIDDKALLNTFFSDASQSLIPGGYCVLELMNFQKIQAEHIKKLPNRSSVRITFEQHLVPLENGFFELHGELISETSNRHHEPGCMIQYPLTTAELNNIAKNAGFEDVQYYRDFSFNPFDEKELSYIAVLKKKS